MSSVAVAGKGGGRQLCPGDTAYSERTVGAAWEAGGGVWVYGYPISEPLSGV